jgi:hypothetical protein
VGCAVKLQAAALTHRHIEPSTFSVRLSRICTAFTSPNKVWRAIQSEVGGDGGVKACAQLRNCCPGNSINAKFCGAARAPSRQRALVSYPTSRAPTSTSTCTSTSTSHCARHLLRQTAALSPASQLSAPRLHFHPQKLLIHLNNTRDRDCPHAA